MEYKFKRNICDNTIFEIKKIDINDIELLKEYKVKDWNNEELNYENEIKRGKWVINKEKDMFLIGIGGGMFEIPQMFNFGFKGTNYVFSFGGGGDSAYIFEKLENEDYNETMVLSRDTISTKNEEMEKYFAEAMAIQAFSSKHLNEFTIRSYIKSPNIIPNIIDENELKEKIDKHINEEKRKRNKNQSFLKKICKRIFK